MNKDWSDQQQRWMAALGYTLYRLGDARSRSNTEIALPTLASSEHAADTIAAPRPGSLAGAEPAIAPLLRALLRAAGLDPTSIVDAESWLGAQQVPSLAQLRNDPDAKRMLWPRLRASRRKSASR
ncbi:MAG TPA: hypothetical protein VK660_00245 [Xanthomonadaceae bacterium]|jgi:hypothetical protein|nr:hypothetical protein [Xanthomonadaceae bacterium]